MSSNTGVKLFGLFCQLYLVACLKDECYPLDHPLVDCFQPISNLGFRHLSNNRFYRRRRAVSAESNFEIDFYAFRRRIHLKLNQGSRFIPNNVTIDMVHPYGRRTTELASSSPDTYFYSGFLEGEPQSRTFGWFDHTNNEFDGVVVTEETTFNIEPSRKYVNSSLAKHIIYRISDYKSTPQMRCGYNRVNTSALLFNSSLFNIHSLRKKRRSIFKSNIVCSLHLVADYSYFKHFSHGSVAMSVREMVHNVAEADAIFRASDFDGDGKSDNIGFRISKITIHNTDRFHIKQDLTSDEFLDAFAQHHNFEDVCIGVGFTFREFEDFTVGMAYSGSLQELGGICSPAHPRKDGTKLSYNALVVSHLNFGQRVTRHMASVTVAHELGHAFGSFHDDDEGTSALCSPGGDVGNYLMYSNAVTGQKINHKIFSPCSLLQIRPVLIERAPLCFLEGTTEFCGNGVKEDGEECDCGDEWQCEFLDRCCVPSGSKDSTPCTIKQSHGYRCSGSSMCCDPQTCQLIHAEARVKCELESQCLQESICDGASASCPTPKPHADGHVCGYGSKRCSAGHCNQTLCGMLGKKECQCPDANHFCALCCRIDTGDCEPYFSVTLKTVMLTHGQLCNDNKGYCNTAGQCQLRARVDTSKQFLLMFSETGRASAWDWVRHNWYIIVASILLSIVLLTVNITLCKKKENVEALASKTASMGRVWFEARRQQDILDVKLSVTKNLNYSRISALTPTQCFSRLKAFFPSVPCGTVCVNLVKSSSSEEYAVRCLLLKGYPFRKIFPTRTFRKATTTTTDLFMSRPNSPNCKSFSNDFEN